MTLPRFLRQVRRSPGFFATAVATLALGIGANTAVFSVLYNVLLRPLPYADAERLAAVTGGVRGVRSRMPVAPADFVEWQARARSFESMAAAELWQANLTTGEATEPLRGMRVTPNLFDVLVVQPAVGAGFGSNAKVAVIAHGLWRRRFASDPSIVGRVVRLNGEPYTITGVMPASFHFAPFWAPRMEIWTPIEMTPAWRANRAGQSLRVFARLKQGVSVASAHAEIEALETVLARERGSERTARVEGLLDVAVGDTRPMLWMLVGAVGLVLLLASVNVANLLLARAVSRHREMAVRQAIGGARAAIVRQLLAESFWMALAGAAGGLLVGRWTLDLLVAQMPEDVLPRQMELGFPVEALVFALGASLLAILAFGVIPALYQTAAPAIDALRGGRGLSASARQKQTMKLALAAQIALAFVLLAGAGLLLRSFGNLLSIDPGFVASNVVIAPVSTTGADVRKADFYQALHQRLNAVPGVESASIVNHAPIAGDEWGMGVEIEGREAGVERPRAVYRVAMPGYFRTMRIPLIAGRDFTFDDRQGKPLVAVVNESFASQYAGLGKRVRSGGEWITIAGVVRDVKQQAWTAPVAPEIYIPFLQDSGYQTNRPMFGMTAVVRGSGPLAEAIRGEIRALNSAVAVSRVETMDDAIAHAVARPRLALILLGWFAALALTLAAVGIYGTASFLANERTREIGIRIAVGAEPSEIVRMLGGDAARIVGAGMAAGLASALLLSGAVESMLYGVEATNALTLAAAGLVLGVASMTAALLPARRASRIDPLVALRD